jgi:hypothetical protein
MLEGLQKFRAEGCQLNMTARQRGIIDELLGESDSTTVFVRECLKADPQSTLTSAACYAAYVGLCGGRGWRELSRRAFGNVIGELVAHNFGLSMRHDVRGNDGTLQRGWKGVGLN